MSKPETRLQKKIQKALTKAVGGWWIKLHGSPMQKRGLPDLHGTVKGLSIWIEVKMPGKEPSILQQATMDEINRKGEGFAFWSTTVEDTVSIVRQYVEVKGGGLDEKKEAVKKSYRKGKSSSKISGR